MERKKLTFESQKLTCYYIEFRILPISEERVVLHVEYLGFSVAENWKEEERLDFKFIQMENELRLGTNLVFLANSATTFYKLAKKKQIDWFSFVRLKSFGIQ